MSDRPHEDALSTSATMGTVAVEAGVHLLVLGAVVMALGLVPETSRELVRLLAGLSLAYLLARMAGFALRLHAYRRESRRLSAETQATARRIRERLDQHRG